MSHELTVGVVRTVAGLHALESDWRTLVVRSRQTLPFRTFEWNAAWWAAFAEDRPSVRDELAVRTVRHRGTNELVAVAPFTITSRPARGPFRTRTLQLFGADPNVTELRGLVCAEADEQHVIDALWKHLLEHSKEWDWVLWSGVRSGSESCRRIEAQAAVQWTGEIPAYVLELPETFDQFRGALPRNVKESIRKCYNSVKRDGHRFDFAVIEKPDEVGIALDECLQLHSSRAVAEGGVQHRDVFASGAAKIFLKDVCDRFAAQGVVRVFALRIGGDTVATRIGFKLGDSLYLYYSGYDMRWAQYSVMTTCVVEAIKWAFGNQVATVHLSTGTDVSKTRWRPTETVYREGVQIAPRRAALLNRRLMDAGGRVLRSRPIERFARQLFGRRSYSG